ncbi:MAG: hypothetical protein HGJ97_19735, partial [Desulfosporosinus sp.]|nr:hypothetical protein [Desulfosporosinus sp.]
MSKDIRDKLAIESKRLDEINAFLMNPKNKLVNDILAVVEKYGGPEEINRKAREAGNVDALIARLRKKNSPYV